MKLKLNFDLYKGKTRLREWWKEVKKHFTEVQNVINTLDDDVESIYGALEQEIGDRKAADSTVIDTIKGEMNAKFIIEKAGREASDKALDEAIKAEATKREYGDDVIADGSREITPTLGDDTSYGNINLGTHNIKLYGGAYNGYKSLLEIAQDLNRTKNNLDSKIATEAEEKVLRETADNALDERVKPLEAASHTHDNKEILDAIDAERVEKWDGIKEQVTQEQLDAVFEHLYEIAIGHDLELEKVYYAIGLTVYDGGLIGAPISGTLDCGEIDDEITGIIDCGGPEPYIAEIAADSSTIDGGTLDTPSDGSKIIDGGEIK